MFGINGFIIIRWMNSKFWSCWSVVIKMFFFYRLRNEVVIKFAGVVYFKSVVNSIVTPLKKTFRVWQRSSSYVAENSKVIYLGWEERFFNILEGSVQCVVFCMRMHTYVEDEFGKLSRTYGIAYMWVKFVTYDKIGFIA